MPNFGKIILTNAGINALVKAQAGNVLTFTKIKMGSGMLSGGIEELTDLVEVQLSADVIKKTITDQTCTVEANFTNEGLKTGFYWREIGLYVKDGSGNDALFGYANAGTSSDYIPATESEIYTKHVRIAVAVGAIENITIQNSGAYVDTITFNDSLGKKVDKEDGKGLSENDFTDEYKSKLDGIADGANKYVLPTATSSTLGGIKSGGAVTVQSDGTVSLNEHSHTADDITDLPQLLSNIQRIIGELQTKVEDDYVTKSDFDSATEDIINTLNGADAYFEEVRIELKNDITSLNTTLGTTNISNIGDGTVKGAILALYDLIQAVPTISSGTSEPSGGVDGDVYIMHE